MGLSNEFSCEAGSFSHCHLNPYRCFQSEALRLYFPVLEPWVARSVSLPSCSSQFICSRMWDCPTTSLHPACPSPPASSLPRVLSALLPISASPTGLKECFFFKSLVVGLPYSLISHQFWLVFVFKFVVDLLLVV